MRPCRFHCLPPRLLAAAGLCLLFVRLAPGFDFSSPATNLTVTVDGAGTVTCQVVDPLTGQVRTDTVASPGVANTPVPAGGVVAWVAEKTVYYRLYDLTRGAWMGGARSLASNFVSEPKNSHGLVAWNADTALYGRVYDPARGVWMPDRTETGGFIDEVKCAGGVMACVAGANTVHYSTYDFAAGRWRKGAVSHPGAPAITDLTVADGVVAWSAANTVYCRLYDPAAGAWRETFEPDRGYVTNLRIVAGTVYWTADYVNYTRGYDRTNGVWYAGPTRPAANFFFWPTSGDAPLAVWFLDLSLGATAWSWRFGDGAISAERTPWHLFTGFARFTNTLTVSGPAGSHATNKTLTTDITPPAGTVLINDGAAYTRAATVTLTLTATDNSGLVTAMRFSNTGTNWSAWEPFAPTRASWTLSAGDGLKTVYAQFKDPAENVSAPASDTITLDTRPLPTVLFLTNNFVVPETNGPITLTVTLSAPTVFTAAVDFATSDGTATAGSDYAATSGRLIFYPGETLKTFSIFLSNDTLAEVNETILLALANPTNCFPAGPATVTILDDDPPAVAFASAAFAVGENLGQALISIQLSAASGRTVSVQCVSRDGSARAGRDYASVSNRLEFLPGQATRSFLVPILDDRRDEPEETVLLALALATNAVLGSPSNAVLSIVDDDPPEASFASALFVTNEAPLAALLAVQLSSAYTQTVYVDFQTLGGTATVGEDYLPASGTLTFTPGATSKTFFVTILSNAAPEPIETVTLQLLNFVVATPGPVSQATLCIVDQASAPWLWQPVALPDGSFQCTVLGPAGRRYCLEAARAPSGASWTEVGRGTNSGFTTSLRDPEATNSTRRFYRARQLE